jgi:DNA repair exonuclease SbcCD ATPase subunit
MKISNLRLRGIGPFVTETAIDFDALPGDIIALVGKNGAGKSTLLNSIAACITPARKFPRGDTMASRATARDSFAEVSVVNGKSHVIRHEIDCVTGGTESLVLDESGRPRLPTTSVAAWDKWAKDELLPPSVLYASIFAAQGRKGILDMDEGERKAILLRVLGIEHLEGLAKEARNCLAMVEREYAVDAARLQDERARGYTVSEATQALEQLRIDVALRRQEHEAARKALLDATAHAVAAKALNDTNRGLKEQRARLVERHGVAFKEWKGITTRVENNRGILADAEDIRAAVERLGQI